MVSYFLLTILAGLYYTASYAEDWTYTIRPGDTLWEISRTHLRNAEDWRRIQTYNNLIRPTQLAPGTRLKIPIAWLKNPPVSAKVLTVAGDIQVFRGSGEIKNLSAGDPIYVNDTLRSTTGSAQIQLPDGSKIFVQENSDVKFRSLANQMDRDQVNIELRLEKGRIETQVLPLKHPDSRFEILTPAAVAAVRGTSYRVQADVDKKLMRAEVVEGSIEVANELAKQTVPESYGTVTEQGKAPLPPRQLLEATSIRIQAINDKKPPILFNWDPLPGALHYRLRVQSNEQPPRIIHDSVQSDVVFNLAKAADGDYLLTVRGIDDIGLEGKNATLNFTVDTSLKAPLALPIVEEPTVTDDHIVYRWQPVAPATSYQVQVASDSTFKTLLIDQSLTENQFVVNRSAERDDYYFRIRGYSAAHEVGEFSNALAVHTESSYFLYYLVAGLIAIVVIVSIILSY